MQAICHKWGLFPAHAGVIPTEDGMTRTVVTFPRTRGGDPANDGKSFATSGFSPRIRG